MHESETRRTFLHKTGLAALAAAASSGQLLAADKAPDEGILGAGGMDKSHRSPRSIDFRIRLMSRNVPSGSGVSSTPNYAIR